MHCDGWTVFRAPPSKQAKVGSLRKYRYLKQDPTSGEKPANKQPNAKPALKMTTIDVDNASGVEQVWLIQATMRAEDYLRTIIDAGDDLEEVFK